MKLGTLEKKIKDLPDDYKLKLEGYIDALLDDAKKKNPTIVSVHEFVSGVTSKAPTPVFGSGKGIFGEMSDDFDEPLDDMKEYMN